MEQSSGSCQQVIEEMLVPEIMNGFGSHQPVGYS